MIVSASVVIYKTSNLLINNLVNCCLNSKLINILYVIDNSPVRSEFDFSKYAFVCYIKTDMNVGYGSGHNLAIRKALYSSKYHLVLNPDIFFHGTQLEFMIHKMESNSNIGLLSPTILNTNGDLQYLCKLLPSPTDLISRRFFSFLSNPKRFELQRFDYKSELNVPFLSGCFMLFRLDALADVGLFDERFFMYGEDIDISRRIHSKYLTLYFPGASIIHGHARESYLNLRMLLIHIVNIIRYFNKWGWFLDSERKQMNNKLNQCIDSLLRK